jgi:hypothetical protein
LPTIAYFLGITVRIFTSMIMIPRIFMSSIKDSVRVCPSQLGKLSMDAYLLQSHGSRRIGRCYGTMLLCETGPRRGMTVK